jgi:hypothetical protein
MPVNFNIDSLNVYSAQIDNFSKTQLVNSEINTRRKLIDPLLELLGWDISRTEVILEYPIKIGSRTISVDFALSTNGKPSVFIEAKSFNTNLTEDYSDQIISYCRVEGVRWAGLTNGRQLKIFDTRRGRREKDSLICEIDLKSPSYYLTELSILHKDAISSGESESIVTNLMNRKKAIMKVQESKNDLISSYSRTLSKLLGDYDDTLIKNISNQLASKTIELFENESGIIRVEPPKIEKEDSDLKEKQDWNYRLSWTTPETKNIALDLKSKIIAISRNIQHQVSGIDYVFSKGKRNTRSLFAAIMLRKKWVAIRVRYDPSTTLDPLNIVGEKTYNWFFKGNGQEREMKIKNSDEIEEAIKLIKKSYELAE